MTDWNNLTEEQRIKRRQKSREYYKENAERLKELSRKWYAENKEKSSSIKRKYSDSARGRAVGLMNRINAQKRRKQFGKSNLEVTITAEWIQEKIETARCPVTGIEFDLGPRNGFWSPFSPSVDRIDPSKGYTVENCRVVCLIFNIAKNQFSDDDVVKMAKALVVKNGK